MISPRFPRAHYCSARRPPTKPALCAQMSRLADMARNKKGSVAALDDDRIPGNLRRSGRGFFGPRLNGPGILALGLDVAIDELDHRDCRGIAIAEAGLHDAGIAAVAVLVARADHLEQLLDHGEIAHLRDRLAARVQVAALAERDQLFDDRAQILRLGQRRRDLLVLDQRSAQVRQHRFAMIRAAAELAVGLGVTHGRTPCLSLVMPGLVPGMTALSNDPQSAWRALRYSPAASRGLPCPDADPSAPALP